MENASAKEITHWLEQHGLGQYAARFVENDIDRSLLTSLTEEDLKELGLTIGHRRRFSAAFDIHRGTAVPDPEASHAPERRQLTVMFCDMVGSTSLSSRLDPEDLRTVMHQYYKACEKVILRHHGFIASYLGDGLMSYFGYPEAREDAAESAVRAGLAIIDAVRRLEPAGGGQLKVRLGIATGLAVVGDLLGKGASELHSVIGQTPNLAARVQSLAEPDTLVIAGSTQMLVRGQFDYVDLGVHQLKGIEGAVPVWRVVGEASGSTRFEAQHADPSICVGRGHELKTVADCWQSVLGGQSQVILIIGEAGIGKSHLLSSISDQAAAAGPAQILLQCSSDQSSNPLYPLISELRRTIPIDPADDIGVSLARIETWLGDLATTENVGLVANLFGLPLDSLQALLPVAPEQRKARRLGLFLELLQHRSLAQPVLLIVEDAHWIDAVTQELLESLAAGMGNHRVMLAISARTEYRDRIAVYFGGTVLNLARLGSSEAEQVIGNAARGRSLSQDVIRQILDKSDGIPLYLEELTKSVLGMGRRDAGVDAIPAGVPSILLDGLMGRLDRLGRAKEIAQIASCLGRSFSFALIAALAHGEQDLTADMLMQLVEGAFLVQDGTPPNSRYTFKHALLQDAAYESLLRSRRRDLHAEIVGILETAFPDEARNDPGLLAHHCRQANLPEREAEYLFAAAQAATRLVAVKEALGYLNRAEEILAGLAPSPDTLSKHVEVILMLMDVGRFMILPSRHIELAIRLKEKHAASSMRDDPGTLASILFQQGRAHLYTSNYAEASSAFGKIIDLGRSTHDPDLIMKPGSALTMTLCCQGQFADSLAFLDREKLEYYKTRKNFIDYIAGLGWCGYATCQQGDIDSGLRINDLAINESRTLGSLIYSAGAHVWKCQSLIASRFPREAVVAAQRCVEVGRSQNVPYLIWHGLVFLAFAHCRSGDFPLARRGLADVHAFLESFPQGLISVLDYPPMIEAEIACFGGEVDRAVELGGQAVKAGASRGGIFTEALANRVLAVAGLLRGDALEAATQHMDRALELLHSGGAHVERTYSMLVWAHALARMGHQGPAVSAVTDARALAETYALDLSSCEYGAAEALKLC